MSDGGSMAGFMGSMFTCVSTKSLGVVLSVPVIANAAMCWNLGGLFTPPLFPVRLQPDWDWNFNFFFWLIIGEIL